MIQKDEQFLSLFLPHTHTHTHTHTESWIPDVFLEALFFHFKLS